MDGAATPESDETGTDATSTHPAGPRQRPGPLRWIWYALGGRLPRRHAAWVLHDVTTRTWVLRHVTRTMVQLAVPLGLVLLLVPGAFWIRGMAALGGILLAMIYSFAYITEFCENRAVQAGYPVGTASAVRDRLAADREVHERRRRQEAAARRAERYRTRQGR